MDDLLADIIGQTRQIQILHKIYHSKRIPNAFLFTGTDGVGKHFTAIKFLQLLNSGKDYYKQISQLTEPFVQLIIPLPRGKSESNNDTPTGKLTKDTLEKINEQVQKKIKNPYYKISLEKANNIKISSIREIKKKISYNFDEIKYRGIIISDAHLMSIEAQNALLKSLEEPPEGVIFFLITDSVQNLLPTIKSRCWEIQFNTLNNENLKQVLTKFFNIDPTDSEKVIPFANGSATFASNLVENDFNKLVDETIILLRYSLAKRFHTAIKQFNNIINSYPYDSLNLVIQLILKWLDDVIKDRSGISNFYFNNHKETFLKFNKRYPEADVYTIFAELENISSKAKSNVSLNLIILNTIFKLSTLIKG